MGKKKVKTPLMTLQKDQSEVNFDIKFQVNSCMQFNNITHQPADDYKSQLKVKTVLGHVLAQTEFNTTDFEEKSYLGHRLDLIVKDHSELQTE